MTYISERSLSGQRITGIRQRKQRVRNRGRHHDGASRRQAVLTHRLGAVVGKIPHRRGAVISTTARMFPDCDKWNIMAILDQYNCRYSTEAGRARVQLAILKLSEGNIEKLR